MVTLMKVSKMFKSILSMILKYKMLIRDQTQTTENTKKHINDSFALFTRNY